MSIWNARSLRRRCRIGEGVVVVVVVCGLLVGRDMGFACDAGVGEVGGVVRSIWPLTTMARR
jgi:hypothetical protein